MGAMTFNVLQLSNLKQFNFIYKIFPAQKYI